MFGFNSWSILFCFSANVGGLEPLIFAIFPRENTKFHKIDLLGLVAKFGLQSEACEVQNPAKSKKKQATSDKKTGNIEEKSIRNVEIETRISYLKIII